MASAEKENLPVISLLVVFGLPFLHGHVAHPGVWWFPATTLLFSVTPGGNNEATPTFVSLGNDETQQSAGFPGWNPAGFSAPPGFASIDSNRSPLRGKHEQTRKRPEKTVGQESWKSLSLAVEPCRKGKDS